MEQYKSSKREFEIASETREGMKMILAIKTVKDYLNSGSIDPSILSFMVNAADIAINKTNSMYGTSFPKMKFELNIEEEVITNED